ILEVNSKAVVVDANHRWAGQTLELEVMLVAFLEPPLGPVEATADKNKQRAGRSRVVAFDVDTISLASLRDALPGWEVVVVNGATAASLAGHWDPGAAGLLVVGTSGNATETLGLCRLLSFCTSYSTDARIEGMQTLASQEGIQKTTPEVNAPLLVL